jgi:mRNA interferase MazF
VNRGAVVVVSGASGIGSKPRPAVVVQNDNWIGTKTLLVAPFTSDIPGEMILRPVFEPDGVNGLKAVSTLMVDKITPAKRSDVGETIGLMQDSDMDRIDASLRIIFALS